MNTLSIFSTIRKSLENKIRQHFGFHLGENSVQPDSNCLCASLLDPTVAFLLNNYKLPAVAATRDMVK